MATVADRIVRALRASGVRALFGVPGGASNLDLIDAAGRADLPFVLTATETAGAIAAIAQAEITGQPGACLTTLGPGATSVVNGAACALLERAPLLVFSDAHPVSAEESFEHQQIDQTALFRPVTLWSGRLAPDSVDQIIASATHAAMGSPPGPVHIECPGGVAAAPAPDGDAAPLAGSPRVKTPADAHFDELIARAKKPLVLVGLGARRPEDAEALRQFCDRHGLPALVTYKAKGVIPDDHRWFGGVFTHAAIEQPIIDDSDLLIGVGLDPVELLPRPWRRQRTIVYCGRWPVDSRHVSFDAQLIDDVPSALAHISTKLSAGAWDAAAVRAHLDEQRRRIAVPGDGFTAQQVIGVAAGRLASIARVTIDAGAHMLPATVLWPVHDPNHMLISNGLSTMGFALPAAIGAAWLDRERPVVALTGDGGLLMCVGELLTVVREKLRVVTIVFSDRSLSLIEIKQQQRHLPAAGVALGAVDWPMLAGSFGVTGFVARDEAELATAIDHALALDGPALVEAVINPANYGETMKAVRG